MTYTTMYYSKRQIKYKYEGFNYFLNIKYNYFSKFRLLHISIQFYLELYCEKMKKNC